MRILLFLLAPIFCYAQQNVVYKNLALEGGGIRGIAYAGAFKVLEEKCILQKIENVAGSSVGAIAGLMISIGYNAAEIDSIMMSLPFEKFNDGRGGLYGKVRRIKREFGIYKGDTFKEWLEDLLLKKTGNAQLNFMQLHKMKLKNDLYKDLYCTATNISKQRLEIFSYKHTPYLPLATAVRISGGIPIYFTPILLDNDFNPIAEGDTSCYINYYVDGGMLCNYPISMFDSCKAGGEPIMCDYVFFNKQTLGIKLERPEQIENFLKNNNEIPAYNPKSFKDYFEAFGNLMIETLERKYPNLANEKGRTIYISYGKIGATIKKMNYKSKRFLFDNGVAGVTTFFENGK